MAITQYFRQITISLLVISLLFPGSAQSEDDMTYDSKVAELHFDWQAIGNSIKPMGKTTKAQFKNDLERELQRDMAFLSRSLNRPSIIAAIQSSNREYKDTNLTQIMELDKSWRSGKDSTVVTKLIDPACSSELKALQGKRESFAEIFVTNEHGLNVCQTNKTSDAYQADEEWWISTMKRPHGEKLTHGKLEYDSSAHTYAISIYVPVIDPETKQTIGISKGVVRRAFQQGSGAS